VKHVILTGDDFGLARTVNDAIELAHTQGVLTAASLMVSGEAAADAVDRACRLPALGVGLHVVLVEGRPVLPPEEVPDLVEASGEFSTRLVRAGFRFAFVPGIRPQLEAEVRAQFEAFQHTGLELDHADVHNHMHLHPSILDLVLDVGREFGLRAVRLPNEPPLWTWRASRTRLAGRLASAAFLSPLVARMRAKMARAGVVHNDYLLGMSDSGAMVEGRVLALLEHLKEGVTEIHFHPASGRAPEIDRTMPTYVHEEELKALLSPKVRAALSRPGIERTRFTDLFGLRR
jgi:hopanoid biosynthesis associated protein HpnK